MHTQQLGEYIGVESCTDFKPDVAAIVASPGGGAGTGRSSSRRRRRSGDAAAVAEYPPPLPLLARTENLQPHMPWVMRKHRTSDGRLVITEEKARRHEYFQVHRSGGRLVLNLVPVNVDFVEEDDAGEGDQGGFIVPGNVADSGEKMDGRNGGPPPPPTPEEVCAGVEPCGGFGVAMGGLMPPVHT